MPELQKKIAPLTQLHSSWLEVKENVQKEEQLKIKYVSLIITTTVFTSCAISLLHSILLFYSCEKELKIAEELVYDYCFKKSLELEKIKKK